MHGGGSGSPTPAVQEHMPLCQSRIDVASLLPAVDNRDCCCLDPGFGEVPQTSSATDGGECEAGTGGEILRAGKFEGPRANTVARRCLLLCAFAEMFSVVNSWYFVHFHHNCVHIIISALFKTDY